MANHYSDKREQLLAEQGEHTFQQNGDGYGDSELSSQPRVAPDTILKDGWFGGGFPFFSQKSNSK